MAAIPRGKRTRSSTRIAGCSQAEHEGKHDFGCHITGGKHREKKKAAQKHRIDIRRYGQIVFVSSSSGRCGGRGAVSCLSAREQFELVYYRH
jgi:hypothetical protein